MRGFVAGRRERVVVGCGEAPPLWRSARPSFATVVTFGECFADSMRLRCSKLMPAACASARCVNPAAVRAAMIFRASVARAYSTAGKLPSASASGTGGSVPAFASAAWQYPRVTFGAVSVAGAGPIHLESRGRTQA